MNPLAQLVICRLRESFREPGTIFWTFGFPILLALGLGLAFRQGTPQRTPVAVLSGPEQSARIALLSADPRFSAVAVDSLGATRMLREGKAVLVIGGDVPVTYRFDPHYPEAVTARLQADDLLQRKSGRADPLPSQDRAVTAPGARYIDFLIPGLLGLNIMSGSLWGMGWVIVWSRRNHLLKRLMATPMRRSHYLLSHILSRLVFLVAEVGVLVGFAWLAFDVRVEGSLVLLAAFCLLGAMCSTGLGILLACRTRSSETISGLINFAAMPMFILSGVFFSTAHFPDWLQPIVKALPMTALNDALRIVFQGGALAGLLLPTVVMVLWSAICFALALRFFKWT